ncbi:MAG: IPTL-CTERM sorting domain-containing protein [candidate division Zixibacteria bacterium]|nr:IPTL-CTERM sorting domain-containing protein [candidate division Zixibacteria bacterium]
MRKVTVLSGLLVIALALSAAAATDIVFVVDGSGSISPADFQLMKDGIDSALTSCLPQDGSVRVGLVQFSSTAQRELSMTTVTLGNLAAISAAVTGMTQLNAATNYEIAIDTACAVISGSGADVKALCFVSDGVPNQGNTNTAALSLNASGCGYTRLDAFGVGIAPVDEPTLKALVFPQPDSTPPGMYIAVTDYQEFKDGICAKVSGVVGAIPTLSEWGMILFAAVLFASLVWYLRRQRRTVSVR